LPSVARPVLPLLTNKSESQKKRRREKRRRSE
jgi:hypothetical protein